MPARKSSSGTDHGVTLRRSRGEILWTCLWLFALFVAGNLLIGWTKGDRLLTVRMTHYLLPWFLLCLLAAMIPAALSRRVWLMSALALPALVIAFQYLPLFLPGAGRPPGNYFPLKVMSFNVWSENRSLAPVAKLIQEENPDILLLQEINPEQMLELRRFLAGPSGAGEPKLNFVYAPHLLQAVASPYPVTQLMANRKKGKMQEVRVMTPAGEIEVFNVHPLRGNWKRRHRQMATLLHEDILSAGKPVILAGDFNTTDKSETYQLLSRYLRNAHWEAGWGFGFSYPADLHAWQKYLPAWPLVRIDHIFYSPQFSAISAKTLSTSAGSDHFPVIADLALKKSNERQNPPVSTISAGSQKKTKTTNPIRKGMDG
jgi:vancomycin resistance protein VanJ